MVLGSATATASPLSTKCLLTWSRFDAAATQTVLSTATMRSSSGGGDSALSVRKGLIDCCGKGRVSVEQCREPAAAGTAGNTEPLSYGFAGDAVA
jgi:hypothetical protein